jgi:hypothetical protein
LLYRETKTEASEAVLPRPDLRGTALKERRADQLTDAAPFGDPSSSRSHDRKPRIGGSHAS